MSEANPLMLSAFKAKVSSLRATLPNLWGLWLQMNNSVIKLPSLLAGVKRKYALLFVFDSKRQSTLVAGKSVFCI